MVRKKEETFMEMLERESSKGEDKEEIKRNTKIIEEFKRKESKIDKKIIKSITKKEVKGG